jgi:hypothetical protein
MLGGGGGGGVLSHQFDPACKQDENNNRHICFSTIFDTMLCLSNPGSWQLAQSSPGEKATGSLEIEAAGSWAKQSYANVGDSRQVSHNSQSLNSGSWPLAIGLGKSRSLRRV